MISSIDLALNMFYQRSITTREQLLNEFLRVKLTKDAAEDKSLIANADKLYLLMKRTTEKELGFFPADKDFFSKIFDTVKDIDLIDFALEIYKNDRMGIVIAPAYLTEFAYRFIDEKKPSSILITEAEKHLAGLRALINNFPDKEFTFTTQYQQMYMLLSIGFGKCTNVAVLNQSIYTELLTKDTYDFIFCLPTFTGKTDELSSRFITDQSEGIAIENMLSMLSEQGLLSVVAPAKVTFAGGSFAKLREYIAEKFNITSIMILPEGTFRPYSAIKTYMINISKNRTDKVTIGTVEYQKDRFQVAEHKDIPQEDFLSLEDWRIEIILSDDDENIRKFKHSTLERVKLKNIAEIFRGKSILKKDVSIGKISVLNISDIDNGEINYGNMDSIDEDERKIKRYELEEGDLVLTCRGTAIKTAVFKKQDNIVIASANVVVIRPNPTKVVSDYIKLFFESPVGTTLIKSFQRGTTIMNINHTDIMEIEVPIVPMSQQINMVDEYKQELIAYKEVVISAEKRWQDAKNRLYEKLY